MLTINEQRLDALEIGTRLAADGRLEQASAVYLLTFDELRVAVGGTDADIDTSHVAGAPAARGVCVIMDAYPDEPPNSAKS